jgi:hypothetical protein
MILPLALWKGDNSKHNKFAHIFNTIYNHNCETEPNFNIKKIIPDLRKIKEKANQNKVKNLDLQRKYVPVPDA